MWKQQQQLHVLLGELVDVGNNLEKKLTFTIKRAFSNTLKTLKLIPNFRLFSKLLRGDVLNALQSLLRAFAQSFEKNTLSVPIGFFQAFWTHWSWVQIWLSFSKFYTNDAPNTFLDMLKAFVDYSRSMFCNWVSHQQKVIDNPDWNSHGFSQWGENQFGKHKMFFANCTIFVVVSISSTRGSFSTKWPKPKNNN